MRSETHSSPSTARLSSWSRAQAHSELALRLTSGELDPTSEGDPAATTVFAFVSVLVAKAGADGEAWYGQDELRRAIRAKDLRTVCRVVSKARELELFWTRPRGWGNRACLTYVLELGRTSAELGRRQGVEVLQSVEKRTSERPEIAACAIVLRAYEAARARRWEGISSGGLEPEAPVLEPLAGWLEAMAHRHGLSLVLAAEGAMGAYMACKGLADGALLERCHPIEWWDRYKAQIERGIIASARRRPALAAVPSSSAPKLDPAEERALVARLASGNFPTLQRAGTERSWIEGKRVASAGRSGRLSASTLS